MSLQNAIVSVFQRRRGFSDREWRSVQRWFTLFGLEFSFPCRILSNELTAALWEIC